jgi:hypothetical protein
MYYKIKITHTSKTQGRTDQDYHIDWEEVETFKTLKEAREYIDEHYKKSQQKAEMYRDIKDGDCVQVGWIYGYKDTFYNRGEPDYSAFCEDWVELLEVKEKAIIKHF